MWRNSMYPSSDSVHAHFGFMLCFINCGILRSSVLWHPVVLWVRTTSVIPRRPQHWTSMKLQILHCWTVSVSLFVVSVWLFGVSLTYCFFVSLMFCCHVGLPLVVPVWNIVFVLVSCFVAVSVFVAAKFPCHFKGKKGYSNLAATQFPVYWFIWIALLLHVCSMCMQELPQFRSNYTVHYWIFNVISKDWPPTFFNAFVQ